MPEINFFFYLSTGGLVDYRVGSSPFEPRLDCHALVPGHCHHIAMSNGYLDAHHVNHPQAHILRGTCPNTHHAGGVKCEYTQPSPPQRVLLYLFTILQSFEISVNSKKLCEARHAKF